MEEERGPDLLRELRGVHVGAAAGAGRRRAALPVDQSVQSALRRAVPCTVQHKP